MGMVDGKWIGFRDELIKVVFLLLRVFFNWESEEKGGRGFSLLFFGFSLSCFFEIGRAHV